MKPASAKAKGRRFQNYVAGRIRAAFLLPKEDVKPAIMGERGRDIHLSQRAAKVFPYAVECKNVETLNIWKAMEQAKAHTDGAHPTPLLVFRRNRSEVYCALCFEDYLHVLVQQGRLAGEVKRLQANVDALRMSDSIR